MQNLHFLDMSIIFGYLLVCLIMGLLNFKGIKNIRDYTIGGRYISTPILVGTLFATNIGAGLTVGWIEKVYSTGIIFAIMTLISPVIWLTTSFVFCNRIQQFKSMGCITLSDIMENLYGKPGRWVTNIAAKFMAIAVTAMQILAIGYLLSYFLGTSEITGALIGFGVLVLYSILGGIRAVVITDAFQSLMLYIGIPAACFAGYYDVGGLNGILSSLPATHKSFELTYDNIGLILSLIVWVCMPHSHGTFIQRFLMANSREQLKQAMKVLFFGSFPIAIVIGLIGYIVTVKAPNINPNTAFYYMIDNYLPIGIKGLVITGILAAIMSTADSWLNTASVLWAHDIWKKIFPKISDSHEVLVARISLAVIAAFATFLAFFKNESLIALEWLASSFWEPVVFVPLVLGFLGFRTDYRSFSVAVAMGIIFTIIGAHIAASGPNLFAFETLSMCIGLIGSFIGLVGSHYYLRYSNHDKSVVAG